MTDEIRKRRVVRVGVGGMSARVFYIWKKGKR